MARTKIVVGNWKMNLSLKEVKALATELKQKFLANNSPAKIIVAPSYVYLSTVKSILNTDNIAVAAQDCSAYDKGAYTGDVSVNMLKQIGADYIIVGHSERRLYHKESNQLLKAKIDQVLANDLKVIFCIGETLEERQQNRFKEVLELQLKETVFLLDVNQFKNVIIAYEPVWAIGTGITATPKQAQEVHSFIRELIGKAFDTNIGEQTTILYGGSCNAENAKELFACKDIDGGLIGGASLKSNDFYKIASSFS